MWVKARTRAAEPADGKDTMDDLRNTVRDVYGRIGSADTTDRGCCGTDSGLFAKNIVNGRVIGQRVDGLPP
jgi:hypothetical protein